MNQLRLLALKTFQRRRDDLEDAKLNAGEELISTTDIELVPKQKQSYTLYTKDNDGGRNKELYTKLWSDDLIEFRKKINDQMDRAGVDYKVINPTEYNERYGTNFRVPVTVGMKKRENRPGLKNVVVDAANKGNNMEDITYSLVINPRRVTNTKQLKAAIYNGVSSIVEKMINSGAKLQNRNVSYTFSHMTNSFHQQNTSTILHLHNKSDAIKELAGAVLNSINMYTESLYREYRDNFDIGETVINFTLISPTRTYGKGDFNKVNMFDIMKYTAFNPTSDNNCLLECLIKFHEDYFVKYRMEHEKAKGVKFQPLYTENNLRDLMKKKDYILTSDNEIEIIDKLAKDLKFNIAVFYKQTNFIEDGFSPLDLWHYSNCSYFREEYTVFQTNDDGGIYKKYKVKSKDTTIYLIRIDDDVNAHYVLSNHKVLMGRVIKNNKLYRDTKTDNPKPDLISCDKCLRLRLPTPEEMLTYGIEPHVCTKSCMKRIPRRVYKADGKSTAIVPEEKCKWKKHSCKCSRCNKSLNGLTIHEHQCESSSTKLNKCVTLEDIHKSVITYDCETFRDNNDDDVIISTIATGGMSPLFSNIEINYDDDYNSEGSADFMNHIKLPVDEQEMFIELSKIKRKTIEEEIRYDKLISKIDKLRLVYKCSYLFIHQIISIILNHPDQKIADDDGKYRKIVSVPNHLYFMAHNGGKFDNYLIYTHIIKHNDELSKRNVDISVIRDGNNIKDLTLSVTVGGVRKHVHFRDTYAFLPFKLRDLPSKLGFTEQKGDFDHEKNTIADFKKNKNELMKYCKQDCNVLFQACMKLIEFVEDTTTYYLDTKTLGLVSQTKNINPQPKWYRNVFSVISSSGLAKGLLMNVFTGLKGDPKISVCWQNHGLDNHRLDCERKQKILQERGINCYITSCKAQGCFVCRNPYDIVNTYYNTNYIQSVHNHIAKKNPGKHIEVLNTTSKDYVFDKDIFYIIPECQVQNLDPDLTVFPEIKPIRDSFIGGRVDCIHQYVKGNISCIDRNSSYAADLNSDKEFPIGRDILNLNPTYEDIFTKKGVFSVDLLPPKDLKIPYVNLFPNDGVDVAYYCLCATCALNKDKSVCTHSDEKRTFKNYLIQHFILRKAITKYGYKVVKVNYIYENTEWIQGKDYFGNFIQVYDRIKTLSRWKKTEKDHPDIKPDPKYVNNEPYGLLAKTMNASIWGSFSQKDRKIEHKVLKYNEIFPLLQTGKYRLAETWGDENYCIVDFEKLESDNPKDTNYHFASYVTAYARDELYNMIELIGQDAVIYMDTDSVFFDNDKVRDMSALKKVISTRLGDWKYEYENISEIAIVSAKTYSMKIGDKLIIKSKGMTFVDNIKINVMGKEYDVSDVWSPSHINKIIRYEKFGEIDDDYDKPVTVSQLITPVILKSVRRDMTLRFENYSKSIRKLEEKRIIRNDSTLSSIPFGYSVDDIDIFSSVNHIF